MEKTIYSVKQLNSYIKGLIDSDQFLSDVKVEGEVGNCSYNSSGHIYFSIKENNDVINCVMFKSNAMKLKFKIEQGQKIVLRGRVSVYEPHGKYQLYVSTAEPAGEGDLYRKYELLKKELEERGLFSDMYKKAIPKYSLKVGIATSATGSVIQDIRNVTQRRNKYVQLILKPTMVQGVQAAKSIVNSIRALDAMDLDVIIVGRGGGSLEDLWCFNEEIVAQAIFDCKTPIISAVGHETDFSISDFVADLRAPTPSAAAELAVFEYEKFINDLERVKLDLKNQLTNKITNYKNRIKMLEAKINSKSPMSKLVTYKQMISDLREKISMTFENKFAKKKHSLQMLTQRLEGLSPLNKIGNGYLYATTNRGALNSTKDIKVDDMISMILKDGNVEAKVTDIIDGENYGKEK